MRNHPLARRVLMIVLMLAVLPAALALAAGGLGGQADQEGLAMTEASIRRAAVQCYALEGMYPPNLDYLKTTYGVQVDEDRYFVDYQYLASNLMPDITVLALSDVEAPAP